ncbi:hypothetical protein LJC07_00925 [Christensenellaceae bacterium OttesenSCG-928-L17]|nr:hypothetical protein [Christensenellaceae bacterium OttesenSCG-928-L17]
MVLLLSFLCGGCACLLLVDFFFLGGAYYAALPEFVSTAAAFTGILIAGMEYRARKPKKKRRLPASLLVFNAVVGSIAACLWAVRLLT